jgi:hypothetical protein
MQDIKIDAKYFKEYRQLLGFSNKENLKVFFGAKDITPAIDYNYIKLLNIRLFEIIQRIDCLLLKDFRHGDLENFKHKNIDILFEKLKNNNFIAKFNNQGRRPEEVYFSWMRGFIVSEYFKKVIGFIFSVPVEAINVIGDDNINDLETFKRTPRADLEIVLHNKNLRIEIQSGFQGVNDIKQHKILEAKKNKRELDIDSILMHFDFFNGQVAFIKIDAIEESNINWITRTQMEGQIVFNIEQNYFIWRLIDCPPKTNDFLSL